MRDLNLAARFGKPLAERPVQTVAVETIATFGPTTAKWAPSPSTTRAAHFGEPWNLWRWRRRCQQTEGRCACWSTADHSQ